MGPNKDVCLPDPKNPGKFLKHHYHCDVMHGTLDQAADYCGNLAKEENCPVFEYGDVPVSQQGKKGYDEVQKYIKTKAQEGMDLVELSESIPKYWAERQNWVRSIYNRYRKFRKDFFSENPMFKWQTDLVTYLNNEKPDNRTILFMVDEAGNGGKSEIVRQREFLFPNKNIAVIPPADFKSMAFILPDNGADIIFIDAPRQKQFNLDYEFLEQLKNGELLSEKYDVKLKSFETPHVVVFTNSIPKIGKTILTEDRYIIKEITLTPEERESLDSKVAEARPEYLEESYERTREIIAQRTRETEKRISMERASKYARYD